MQYDKTFDWNKKRDEILDKTNNDPNEIIRYVLNEKNTRITKKFIEEVFRNYGIDYEVNDISIFYIAMTHPSYINKDYREMKNLKSILMGINFLKGEDLIPISDEKKHMCIPLGESSYERLEFMGDSILRQIISDYLFIRYKDMDEGDLTKLRSQIENGSSLADMARKIGLPKYILIPRNLEAVGAREKNNKFQCDIFEAFIAAIFYDSLRIKYKDIGIQLDLMGRDRGIGYSLCFKFVSNLIEDEIDLTLLLETETNHKDVLLQQYHKLGWGDPKYNCMETIVDSNKMGKKYFRMYVRDNLGNIIGIGVGSSKQKGEKIAAKRALQFLKIIPDDNEDTILDNNSTEIYFRRKRNLCPNNHKENRLNLDNTDSDGTCTDSSYDSDGSDGSNGLDGSNGSNGSNGLDGSNGFNNFKSENKHNYDKKYNFDKNNGLKKKSDTHTKSFFKSEMNSDNNKNLMDGSCWVRKNKAIKV
jgi:ribonuclease-3